MSLTSDTPQIKNRPDSNCSRLHDALLTDSLYGRMQNLVTHQETARQAASNCYSLPDILPELQLHNPPGNGSHPAPDLMQPNQSIREIRISGKNGHSDTVSGINANGGESLSELVKRLHPNLTESELAHEVRQILKYNHDYGNDLGNPDHLRADKPIYLVSVKYYDANGRITKIEGPTGRVSEFSYLPDGRLAAYKICSAGGAVEDEGQRTGDKWLLCRDGRKEQAKEVIVDDWGNLIATEDNGHQLAHLTNGYDITTNYEKGKAKESIACRLGKVIVRYQYDWSGDAVKVYAITSDNPEQKVLISPESDNETLARISASQGHMFRARQGHARLEADLPLDTFTAANIIRSAESLVGLPVTQFDSSIPTNVGCARMASEALVRAGFDGGIIDATVDGLEQKLKDRHFLPVPESQLQPGDIIIALGPGADDGHTAIYAGNGRILGNSSRRGYFALGDYDATFSRFARRLGYRYQPPTATLASL